LNLRLPLAVTAAVLVAAVVAASASAHARLLPATAYDQTQLYTLAVPNEKEGLTTTKVVMTVPDGFTVRMFDPAEGWERETEVTGSGEDEHVSKVTWTSTGEGSAEGGLFHFTAGSDGPATYTFQVEQSYSDGSVVNWAGPEDSDEPAPTVAVVDSLGGGGDDSTSALTIVALVLGALGLVLGGIALARTTGRTLA
jgi:uncharacterized protein YcnI